MDLKHHANEFWQAWQSEEAELVKLSGREFVGKANTLLTQYVEGVSVELEGDIAKGDPCKLIFTAQGILDNFAKVSALVDTATTQKFDVVAFREPMGVSDGTRTDFDIEQFAIGMDGLDLTFGDLKILPTAGRYTVNLQIKIDKDHDDEQLRHLKNMAFIMLDHVIGEWDFATKIGAVDFVDELDGERVRAKDLYQTIQQIWHDELGHTGEYPAECTYSMAKIDETDEQDGYIFTVNQSANALLADKHLPWCVMVTADFDNQNDLDMARDLEDTLCERMVKQPDCIDGLVVVNLSQSKRVVHLYCHDGSLGAKTTQQVVDMFPQLNCLVQVDYDPAWGWYKI